MELNRRKWLQQTGLLFMGMGLARLNAVAAPATAPAYLFPCDTTAAGPVRLSSNENPYGPSPMARKAMADSVGLSNRYQWSMIRDLIAAIAVKNDLTNDNVLVGAGSTQIIDTAIQYAATAKGSFVVAEPTFSRWAGAAEQCGLQKIAVPLTADKRHDLPAMLRGITADTRMVYLCNPNNPTGTICTHNDLISFVTEATKKTLVLIDEAYLDYTGERSLSSLVSNNERVIVIKTFSKIYGLAGARIGYALAHAKTIDKLGGLQSGANIAISAVSLAGALASLSDTGFIKDSFLQNEKARTYTIQQLEQMNIPCIPSSANFIYFSLASYQLDFFALLKANNIEGTQIFEEQGRWSRITVGTPAEMKSFINAIK